MPITSFGRYEVAVSVAPVISFPPRAADSADGSPRRQAPGTERDDERVAIWTQAFVYFPLLRLLSAAVLIGVVVSFFTRPWRSEVMGQSFWVVLLGAGGVLIVASPKTNGLADFLLPLLAGQMLGLAVVLWVLCRLRKRRRAVSFFIAEAINSVALLGVLMLNMGTAQSLVLVIPAIVGSQLWTLPAALGMIAVRKQFSGMRLIIGLAIALSVVVLPFFGLAILFLGAPGGFESLMFVALPLPYLIMLHLLATRNAWCRAGLVRALGLGTSPALPHRRNEGQSGRDGGSEWESNPTGTV